MGKEMPQFVSVLRYFCVVSSTRTESFDRIFIALRSPSTNISAYKSSSANLTKLTAIVCLRLEDFELPLRCHISRFKGNFKVIWDYLTDFPVFNSIENDLTSSFITSGKAFCQKLTKITWKIVFRGEKNIPNPRFLISWKSHRRKY